MMGKDDMYPHRIVTHYLIFFVAFLLSMTATHGADAKGTEVSFEKCMKCHPGIRKGISEKGAHVPFRKLQCSSCHNPHTSNYEHLIKEEIGKLCKSCHQGKKGGMTKKYSHGPFEEGACLKCHRPHVSENPRLLVAKDEKLCFRCHSEKGSFSKKNKHDPVKKGRCLSCHNPHTSDHELLLKKGNKELCVTCHSVKNTKVKKSHLDYPVQDADCMSCHSPHGSKRSHLVKESLHKPFAKKKCATCHNGLRAKNPLGLKGKGVSTCISCHTAIQNDFKKTNSHVSEGVFCVMCHSPHASDEGHLKKAREAKVCFRCHEDTKGHTRDRKNEHKHPLVKKGSCSACHRPHGSDFILFFRADEVRVCTDCHKRHGKFTHPIGEEAIDPRAKKGMTCMTCHNLMGSPYDFSLRFDRKKQLCIQCHKGY